MIYRADDDEPDEGVCIYLDGLSAHLHGNPETAARDREIRDWLRNGGFDVIEIAAHDLHDREAMTRHFRRLAQYLGMRAARRRLREDPSWFHGPEQTPAAGRRSVAPGVAGAGQPLRDLRAAGRCGRGRRVRRRRYDRGRIGTRMGMGRDRPFAAPRQTASRWSRAYRTAPIACSPAR